MTVASEITRLQTAKSNIKTAIEWKWVSVPSSAKLNTYSTYINQITTWELPSMFVPATLSYSNILYDKNNGLNSHNGVLIYEGLNPAKDTYYNYRWAIQDSSSSWSSWNAKVFVLSKTPLSNGSIAIYTWPGYSNNSYYSYPTIYDKFALNENGTLKVYAIFKYPHFSGNKYSWEDVGIWDMTSWCTTLSSTYIPWLWNWYSDTEAINAKREELKASVGYGTYPILSNSWMTSSPNVSRSSNDYSFTYNITLNS